MTKRSTRAVIASRLYVPGASAASFRMEALAETLAKHDGVTVLTSTTPSTVAAGHAASAVKVKRLPVLRDRTGAIRGYIQYLSFDLPLIFRLLGNRGSVIVAEAPPTTGLAAVIAGTLTRTPVVYYPGDVWTDAVASMNAPRLVVSVMAALERLVIRRSVRTLAVSPEVAERLAALGGRSECVVEVGNGIDTKTFRPALTPPKVARPYFVYTGTMSEWQRPDVFITALAMLGDIDVDIRFFGQGSMEDELRTLAEEIAPGRVHFGGLVSPAASAGWIRGAVAALVSIVPGIGYDFARPTKIYAAAAVGTPVLFAGAPTGAALVADAGLGEAVDFTAPGIAAAMRRLVEAAQDGTSEAARAHRAAWAAENVSLTSVGERASQVVRGVRRAAR